jgi:quinohemoprotein ethanol dehydrogenase
MKQLKALILFGVVATPSIGVAGGPGDVLSGGQGVQRAWVNHSRVVSGQRGDREWLIAGNGYENHHFSKLTEINKDTVESLAIAWVAPLDAPAGIVAEPIVVDGIAYVSQPLAVVQALDAATGELLWSYDPEVDLSSNLGASLISRTNRGVAVWEGRVYIGTGDCRIVALDAVRGSLAWETVVCDVNEGSGAAISAAPIVGDGKVFTGYAGAEFGVRGSVVALDAHTGEELWRFWTVPGDGPSGSDNQAMTRAARTWAKGVAPMGGGVVWDGITYDHQSGLLLFGTAGSVPYSYRKRESAGGDNLFTSSVVAVDADTGEYRWHYQTVPQDTWDYDACMPIVIAETRMGGSDRRVAMIAPKNGYFYSLDLHSGRLLSAGAIVPVNWASGIDLETGRPNFIPEARYFNFPNRVTRVHPGVTGAHNWQAMAYSESTGLVYIPANALGTNWGVHADGEGWYDASGYETDGTVPGYLGRFIAWDPVRAEARWSVQLRQAHNGGALATAGGLVFLGETTGFMRAYNDRTGKEMWAQHIGPAISGNPVTYLLDGEQYLLVGVGSGTIVRYTSPELVQTPANSQSWNGLVAFKLKGRAALPPLAGDALPIPQPFRRPLSAEDAREGKRLWKLAGCGTCHGMTAAGVGRRGVAGDVPDLRYSPAGVHEDWNAIVFGVRSDRGMPGFGGLLSRAEAGQIQSYVLSRSWDGYCQTRQEVGSGLHPYCAKHRSVQFKPRTAGAK